MCQIFTTTWLCEWLGFYSAVAQSTGKTPVKSNNTNTDLQISCLKYIVSKWVLCHKLLWFYRNILLFQSLVIWVKSTWRCRWRFWDSADSAGESVKSRDWDMAKMGSYFFFYWTKYDSTCEESEQMTWIKQFSRVRLAPSNCTLPLAALGVCSSILCGSRINTNKAGCGHGSRTWQLTQPDACPSFAKNHWLE